MKKLNYGILILVLLVITGGLIGKNAIIKRTLEQNLTSALETNVKIDTVGYNIFGKTLNIDGLRIESKEDSSTDVIKIGKISTKINYKKIFDKEITIENMDVKDIILIPSKSDTALNTIKKEEATKELAASIIKNYKLIFEKINFKNEEQTEKARQIFLGTTTPILDKYIDYKLSDYSTEYIQGILKKYTAAKANIRTTLGNPSPDEWVVNIDNFNVKTMLFGRYFTGTVQGVSTDITRMNKMIPIVLKAANDEENSVIDGKINFYKLEGEINTFLNGVNIGTIPKVKEYLGGKLYMNQKIFLLAGTKVFVDGDIDIKDVTLKEEKVAEYFLDDKEAIKIITGGTNENLQNFTISYKYSPRTNKVDVDSNLAEKITIYLGGDADYYNTLKKDFQDKYETGINKAKEKINDVLDGLFK
ncbi:hypothetical protein [Fusobacterium sp. MFO224]|uniref:hypothetical protein n=1 Tax=Fusobacterium sp. MFO224 TaxID=3378070 RepID=UPI0038541262